jgi:hypothetical protein
MGLKPEDPRCVDQCVALPVSMATFHCASECENYCQSDCPYTLKSALKSMEQVKKGFEACKDKSKTTSDLYQCARKYASENSKSRKEKNPKMFKKGGYANIRKGYAVIYKQTNPLLKESFIEHEKIHLKSSRKYQKERSKREFKKLISQPSYFARDEILAYTRSNQVLSDKIKKYEADCAKI